MWSGLGREFRKKQGSCDFSVGISPSVYELFWRRAKSDEGGTYLMFNTLFVHPAADAPVATQGVILSRRWFPCR